MWKAEVARHRIGCMRHRSYVGMAACALFAAMVTQRPAFASGSLEKPGGSWEECYDAVLVATIGRQLSVPIPRDIDWIIMRWPILVDIKVQHVLEGDVERSRWTVLALRHGRYRSDAGPLTLHLRRNRLGTFDIISSRDPRRCASGKAADRGYVQPYRGRTLRDVIREAEEEEDRLAKLTTKWP